MSWQKLSDELACWQAEGQQVTLWWRDDDAIEASPALARMSALSAAFQIPLTLAVIPDLLETSLVDAIGNNAMIGVVQHGFRHTNHAPAGEKSAEYGDHRPIEAMLHELGQGQQVMRRLAGASPALVPPWNRITSTLLPLLPQAGIMAISTFGARATPRTDHGFTQTNTHCDIVAWRTTRGFVGTKAAANALAMHLMERRTGMADFSEPTGLLTHHLVHDGECWSFLQSLFELTRREGHVSWLPTQTAFGLKQ